MSRLHALAVQTAGSYRRPTPYCRVCVLLPGMLVLAMACESGRQLEWCADVGQGATVVISADDEQHGILRKAWVTQLRSLDSSNVEPIAFAADPVSGRVAISDHAHTRVTVLDRNGAVQWVWPGEAQPVPRVVLPASLRWATSGALEVLDPVLGTVFLVDTAGRALGVRKLDSLWFVDLDEVRLIDGGAIGKTRLQRASIADSIHLTHTVVRVQFPTGRRDTIAVLRSVVPAGAQGGIGSAEGSGPTAVATAGDSLVMFGGDIAEMRVRMTTVTGAPVRVLCRAREEAPPSTERGRASNGGQETARPGAPPEVAGLLAMGGRVWVRPGASEPERLADRWFGTPAASFNVYSLSGIYEGTVRVPDSLRLVAGYGNMVFAYREQTPNSISVVAMRVQFLAGREGQVSPR